MVCKYFLPFPRLPFHFVDCYLCCTELLSFDVVTHFYFCFCCLCSWCHIQKHYTFKKIIAKVCIKKILPYVSLRSYTVSSLTLESLIYFKLIFVYGIRWGSNFILLHVNIQFSQRHLLKRLSILHCTSLFLTPMSKISWPYTYGFHSFFSFCSSNWPVSNDFPLSLVILLPASLSLLLKLLNFSAPEFLFGSFMVAISLLNFSFF